MQVDILSEKYKLVIEYNGLYYHSSDLKDSNHRINKTRYFNRLGYTVIHIFENEWASNSELIKSIIRSKTGNIPTKIYARKCNIRHVDEVTKRQFLQANHIQGDSRCKYAYGLFHDNELVAIATLGVRKITRADISEQVIELIRFCSKLNVTVVGGLSKLLKFFVQTHTPHKIISYANLRYSTGNVYTTLGFEKTKQTSPNYYYFKPSAANTVKLLHRFNFAKHTLIKKLPNYDSNLTEIENMKRNGYSQIYDCGHILYERVYR
jgi:hypothetical protein